MPALNRLKVWALDAATAAALAERDLLNGLGKEDAAAAPFTLPNKPVVLDLFTLTRLVLFAGRLPALNFRARFTPL